ncbi:hypothetical protein BDV96DRAFT_585543 [Lophiotrema nucula]|uniref:DUF7892 domain-containing protein n=1 Tax=Lophiotrema nucula TaxID=690887 RepID=A0A6A5YQP6_9PLEO|nr:hypothetical protein BDV96DRAFT_585543 [Lophiotrema nucula]
MEEDREASIVSSVDFYETDNTLPEDASNGTLPTKRKAEELEPLPEKKRRVESPPASSTSTLHLKPCGRLPPEVWQHVFLFCPLATLGRLLQVNRAFHSYLTAVRNVPNAKPEHGFLRLLKSESIWAAARNATPKKPPKPLPGFSELQMWQLAWSPTCQFCGKDKSVSPGDKVWQQGPGVNGVRTIWPFAVRACGPCLLQRCQTDASLLFSAASALRPALSYALITSDQHYIPAYTLQSATTPADVEIAKYYYKPHVEEIMKELEQAQGRGPAAAEEWAKGLEARGKERMKAAENWERWEVKYQWWLKHEEPKRAVSLALSTASTHQQLTRSPTRQAPSPIVHAPTPHTPTPSYVQPRPATIPPQVYTPQPTPRGERNLHDANEAKANRKADIERRCLQLDPPIPPNVLRHMDSFKAAIQISQPMTDYAWSVLQPRLVAQYSAAQQTEIDMVSKGSTLPTRPGDRRQQDVNSKEVKEVLDREWEESQRPVREKLSAIADDFINRDWDHGRAVTYDNTPKFAVDLLVYVRRVFYEEAAKEAGAASPTRQEHDSPATQSHRPILVLENMKWVYDNKLKPLTEQFRKELFLCYGDGCEHNTRFYGFEGVIQHFGAKHTNTFSVGNVVVAWRDAEWPEETPFHPDPISVKHAYYPSSNATGQGHSNYGSYYGGYSRAGTSTPHVQTHFPHASPGPYSQYGCHYNGPYPLPPGSSAANPGYDFAQAYGAPAYQSMAPPGYGPQTNSHGYITSPAMSSVAVAPPPVALPSASIGVDQAVKGGGSDAEHRTSIYDKQVSSVIDMAQDIWKQTSGVKDLPNAVRIYVLLQRVMSKFQLEFNHEPNLNHFLDAFSSYQIPKALKNAPGLSCQACQDGFLQQSSAFPSRSEDRRTYTALNLLSHFKSQHTRPPTSGHENSYVLPPQDWKEDMIELPSDRLISGLIHAPGMDDDKLHMIATVFPRLFPTPLPKIGVIDNNGEASPAHSVSKDSRDASRAGGTPGVTMEKSGPSSLALSYTDSPKPPKPSEDEYDPLRPALPPQGNQSARLGNRRHTYQLSPPTDRRSHYLTEPRYYLPQDDLDDRYSSHREYVEYAPGPRIIRDSGPAYEEYHGRRPLYREHETIYVPGRDHIAYTPTQDRGSHRHGYRPHHEDARYVEHDSGRPEYRMIREPRSHDSSPNRATAQAARFLDEFVPDQISASRPSDTELALGSQPKPTTSEADIEDGSRYTPPPVVQAGDDRTEEHRVLAATRRAAPSTVSNGSRHEEYRSNGRQIPTPDSVSASRRPGPNRRRDRQEYVPSRYYKHMSLARDDPYARGASMSRSQSRRYERYEEQRRRLDQQDTPQPNADRDYDPAYSRDQSVDQAHPDDPYYHQIRHGRPEREYVSAQERLQPYSPVRRRYSGPPEDVHGARQVFVDEYGRPIQEYEIIHVPRDYPRPARGLHVSHAPSRFVPEHDDHIQYVPIPYDRPPPQRYGDRPDPYVYYEETERPLPRRRMPPAGYEPEEPPYEPPPPDIKVENPPGKVPEGP